MIVKPLPCACCASPIAKLVKDAEGVIRLVLVARHHSNQHANIYTLEELQRLWHEFETETVDITAAT